MASPGLALVTGSSRGLGLALSRELARRRWRLIINARGAEALEAARRELSAMTDVVAIAGDVADAEHRLALAAAAREAGRIDVLVNNASILGPSPQPPLLEYPSDVLERVFRTNVVAPMALIAAVHARDAMNDGGAIINVTSDAAVEAYEGWGGYGASKAALEQASAVLAAENPAHPRVLGRPGRHAHRHAAGGVSGRGHQRPAANRRRACRESSR